MSRKLVTQIKDSAIPGKYKRVLEAYAAFANNDGTNIYAAKEKIGKKAGSSPDTIYRNTPDLLACGILTVATAHTCRVENCNKGATHFTGKWGHYTTAYRIDISLLQNAEIYLSAKHQKVCAAKCRKVGSANCGTTQALNQTPAPSSLGTQDSSALTSGSERVSEQVSPSLAALAAASSAPIPPLAESQNPQGLSSTAEEQEQNPIMYRFWTETIFTPEAVLLCDIAPKPTPAMVEHSLPLCARILAHFDDADKDYRNIAAKMVLVYNRAHRGGKYATKQDKALYIRTPQQFLNALESDNATLLNDYKTHNFDTCEICIQAEAMEYAALIRRLVERKRKREEQKKAEEAKKREEEHVAKLCTRCKKQPFGTMQLAGVPDRFNNRHMEKVCDGCYDSEYEDIQSGRRGLRVNVIAPRPGYVSKAEKAAAEANAAREAAKAADEAMAKASAAKATSLKPVRCFDCGSTIVRGEEHACDEVMEANVDR